MSTHIILYKAIQRKKRSTIIFKVKPDQTLTCGACRDSSVCECGLSFDQIIQLCVLTVDWKINVIRPEYSQQPMRIFFEFRQRTVCKCHSFSSVIRQKLLKWLQFVRGAIITLPEWCEITMPSATCVSCNFSPTTYCYWYFARWLFL